MVKPTKVSLGRFKIDRVQVDVCMPGEDLTATFGMMVNIRVALIGRYDVSDDTNDLDSVKMRETIHVEVWKRMSKKHRADMIRSVVSRALLHEMDEWLRVDGERVADPHPPVAQPTIRLNPR